MWWPSEFLRDNLADRWSYQISFETQSKEHILKQLILVAAIGIVSSTGFAQEMARVLSVTPITQQVGVPRQVCGTEQVVMVQSKSGAGAALGAIAGGAIGNAATHGAGQAAATMLGIVGGAVLGDRIEGQPPTQLQEVQRCHDQVFYENRTVAYSVVYEYAGKQYTVQMPQDPGPTLQLQVTPVGSAPAAPAASAQASAYAHAPSQVIVTQPAYPLYVPQPYYPPIALNLGWSYWSGYHGHGHWR